MGISRTRIAVGIISGALLLGGCSSGGSHSPGSHGAAHWSYSGAEGPAHWGSLSKEYEACSDGTRQAPINITGPTIGNAPPPVMSYRTGSAKVANNGHSIQADAASGNGLTLDGVRYSLVQIHFHSPSEMTLSGTHAPIELHFVNSTESGRSVVIAALVQPGADNAAWRPYVDALGLAKDKSKDIELDWSRLLPTDLSTIRFDGSLTTPPCTEGLEWLVLKAPIVMSTAQIQAFERAYSRNNRPVQPLNGRTVVEDDAPR